VKKHINKVGQPFFRKGKDPQPRPIGQAIRPLVVGGPRPAPLERLTVCAIKHGADGIVSHGFSSHYSLRSSLGYEDASEFKPSDIPGFMTSRDRFVTRREAVPVGVAAGQLSEDWLRVRRELLSSDIEWSRER
jgi:hypothetical protein